MDEATRRAIALFRFGVLGPLVSARLDHGDRRTYFTEAAARTHLLPGGRCITLSARTIEAWYYAHKKGGLDALYPETRCDRGKSRAIRPEVAELIERVKREKPRRSIRRIIRMLERARVVGKKELSRASVHRLLVAAGISARPVRGPAAERRSFIAEHAGDLWVGDALRGPMVIAPDGSLRKALLFTQIDNATRYVPHSYFCLSKGEDAPAQEYGLKEAILKYGPPRSYYVDRGPAYVAQSLWDICAELDIELKHAGPGDAEAKGVIERWHRTWREEVGDELPDAPIPLADLNAKHWAWLGAEYHARVHDTTGRAPREHFLAEANELRPVPRDKDLDEVFLHRETRHVRKDGTVRWKGGWLEVRPELMGERVELRFDPSDDAARPRVFRDRKFLCDTVPLDRLANMHRRRRRIAGDPEPHAAKTGLDPLGLIEDEHYRRTRFVGDPPDRAAHDDDDNDNDEEI
jgi:transposase InsO family protein